MTAYSIGGNNYVKLRDIGKAVNFGVTYNAATNIVHIDSTQPYQEKPTPATPGIVTEESVQAVLAGLREIYPHGTVYPTPYRSTSNGPYSRGTYCSGWATLCSDAAFGSLPWRRIDSPSWDQIRPGDLVRYDTEASGHVVVVVKKTDDSSTSQTAGSAIRSTGVRTYPVGGWKAGLDTPSTRDIRNRAQPTPGPPDGGLGVFPSFAGPCGQFVPTLRCSQHPVYLSTGETRCWPRCAPL